MIRNNQKHKAQVLIITIFILTIALVGIFFILNPIKIKLFSMQNFANTYKSYNNAISGLNLHHICVNNETNITISNCNNFINIISTSITNTNNCYGNTYLTNVTCTTAIIISTGTIADLNFEINAYAINIGPTTTIYRLSMGKYKNNIKNILEQTTELSY